MKRAAAIRYQVATESKTVIVTMQEVKLVQIARDEKPMATKQLVQTQLIENMAYNSVLKLQLSSRQAR